MLPTNLFQTALLCIDIQKGFLETEYWGKRNNPEFEQNVTKVLQHFREQEGQIIHIQHCSIEWDSPLRPNMAGCDFMDMMDVQENETIFKKNVHSAFIGTPLLDYLKNYSIKEVVIMGLTTDHCVSTTTRMAYDLGFRVKVVGNACATFDRKNHLGEKFPAELVHQVALSSLHKEFAEVIS